jgi:peptidoglycan/xylan/chitin deacetylase (PgdA/CDA1 family)
MPSPTYDTDFYTWTQTQAEALRTKNLAALDLEHLAEEIESLGIADEHAITRHLQRLVLHLLKWRYQPTHRTPSWRRSIRQSRDAIADRIERSPGLRDYPAGRLPLAYRRARRDAAEETGLPLTTFPEVCPWPLAQVLEEDFWPEDRP